MKTFIHKKILQEQDVENDEEKRMKTSSVRSQQQKINPFKKSCTRQTQQRIKNLQKK
jgi:hypothetical protein